MTDELKHKFERLVADAPPPSTVPSEAVSARVRSVRRRRTAGVLSLTAAAVVAVTLAVGNLSRVDSSPPVTKATSTPTATVASASSAPTAIPTRTPAHTTSTPATRTTYPPSNPPPPQTSKPSTPAAPPLGVQVSLQPIVHGRTVTLDVTVSGTELRPTDLVSRRPMPTSGVDFLNLLGGTRYFWGDGHDSGSDAGTMGCVSGTRPITRRYTYTLRNESGQPNVPGSHTYAKPGTYTFAYTVKYCGDHGWVPVTATTRVVIK